MLDSVVALETTIHKEISRLSRINSGVLDAHEVRFMALTIEDVEYVAALARLGLTSEEKTRLRDQLSAILESMDLLNEIDVSNIPPTAQVIALTNVMRDDVVRPSLTQAQALANAPRQNDGFFEVDSPLGGSEDAG